MAQSAAPARGEAKGEAILSAAKQVFMEYGYAGASMDLVASQARVSKTTLYTRFPSKEALFEATIVSGVEAHGFHDAEEFLSLELEEGLREIGRRFLDLIASPQAFRIEQLVMAESGRFPELAASYYRAGPERLGGIVIAFIENAMAKGLLRRSDSRLTAEIFLWSFRGAAHCESRFALVPPPPPEERPAIVERVVDLFLNGASAR